MIASEHQMVEDRAVDRFCGGGETPRHATIRIAGARVTARVIMRKDDPGAAVKRSVGDDLPGGKLHARFVALVARQMDAARLIVDMRDPQAFNGRIAIGETPGEEMLGSGKAIKLEREFGTLEPHPAGLAGNPLPDDCYLIQLGSSLNGIGRTSRSRQGHQ
jgi:hypothetical protein